MDTRTEKTHRNCTEFKPPKDAGRLIDKAEQKYFFQEDAIPVPRYDIRCPDCGSSDLTYSSITLNRRTDRVADWNMNLSMKCCICSDYIVKIIPVREAVAENFKKIIPGERRITYSDLLEICDMERN